MIHSQFRVVFFIVSNVVLACYSNGCLVAQQDLAITRIAPENCTLYFGWTGELKADPNGAATERWLAQEEIQASVGQLRNAITGFLEIHPLDSPIADELVREMPWLILRGPAAIYVGDIDLQEEMPIGKSGVLIHLGDREPWFRNLLEKVERTFNEDNSDEVVQRTEIDGKPFFLLKNGRFRYEFHVGVVDGNLMAAWGNGAMKQMLANIKTSPPKWMKDLHDEMAVKRIAAIGWLDTSDLWKMAESAGGDIPQFLQLQQIHDIAGVVGIEDDNLVTKTVLHCPQDTKGLLSVIDGPPLTIDQIAEIPDDVTSAFAMRLSLNKIWNFVKTVGKEFRPVEDLGKEQIEFIEEITGLEFEKEILGSFGDTVYTYGKVDLLNPTGGTLASLQIKEPNVFARRLQQVNQSIKDEIEFQDVGLYEEKESGGFMIHSIIAAPLSASWCQADDQLFVALDRKAISSHLRKRKRSTGKLVENQRLADLFAAGELGAPMAISHFDVASSIQLTLPILATMFGEQTPPDFDFSFRDVPSAEVLINGIEPNLTAVYRTKTGFQLVEQHTLPGTASVAMSGVAIGMLLPAVQQARNAARRTESLNNIRQLILSLHNYESVYSSFPCAYTENSDGQKLLSWRVHILPYLGQKELYDAFHLDEPWDSQHNQKLIAEMPAVFKNPQMTVDEGKTCYLGVTGDDGVLVAPSKISKDGKMTAGVTLGQIEDGTSQTIMIVETNGANAVVWTKPSDFDPAEANGVRTRLEGNWPGTLILVGFADGSCRSLNDLPDDKLKLLMMKSDGQFVDDNDFTPEP